MRECQSGGVAEDRSGASFDRINYVPVHMRSARAEWAAEFADRAAALKGALGEVAVRIDHVGSTAVPGLDAKPTIDIQISVLDFTRDESYREPIVRLGYTFHPRSLADPDRRFFSAPDRAAHIHVTTTGSTWERTHLLFRDYLRTHPRVAADYGILKHRLAEEFPTDRLGYTEAKGEFIAAAMVDAESWATRTGWTTG
jgi:GrpB-like predicted nucleotidyltransferase (UPF0157 family)